MKSRFLKYTVVAMLLVFLIFGALVLVRPFYARMVDGIDQFVTYLLKEAGDKLGITIGYETISPSIFSSIEAGGIVIKNKASGEKLIDLKKVSLRYNLFNLLKGDFAGAIKEINFDGGEITLSKESDLPLLLNLKNLFAKKSNSQGTLADDFCLAFNLRITGLVLRYSDENIIAEYIIKNALIAPAPDGDNITLDSTFALYDVNGKMQNLVQKVSGKNSINKNDAIISCDITGKGLIEKGYRDFSSQIQVASLKIASYTLSKISFLLNLSDEQLSLRMVQNILPYNIRGDWHLGTGALGVKVDVDNLDLYDLVPLQAQVIQLKKLQNSTLDGVYEFLHNSKTKELSYSAQGAIDLTQKLIDGGFALDFDLVGNKSTLDAKRLVLNTKPLALDFAGKVIFTTLQLDANANIKRLTLKNGKNFACTLSAKPKNNGTVITMPRLALGEQILSNIELFYQKQSQNFAFDLTLHDGGVVGAKSATQLARSKVDSIINLSGVYAPGKKNVNFVLSTQDLFLDSILYSAMAFVTKEASLATMQKLTSFLSQYKLNTLITGSTDFSSITIAAPRVSVASAFGKDHLFECKINGTGNLFSVEDIFLRASGQVVQGSLQVDIGEAFSDVILSSTLMFNGIPYNFAGTYVPAGYVSILGEYDFEAYLDLSSEERLGSLKCNALPIQIGKMLLSLSAEATYVMIPELDVWTVSVPHLELQDMSGFLPAKPVLSVHNASANNSGVIIETISYADSVSTLAGTGTVTWSYEERILDAISAQFALANPFSQEQISLSLFASNPEQKPSYEAVFANDYYFTLETIIDNFAFSRFFKKQNASDVLNGTITASGTLASPLISLQVNSATMALKGYPLEASGGLLYDDGKITAQHLRALYRGVAVENVVLEFVPKTFTGVLSTDVILTLFEETDAEHSFRLPLVLSCKNLDEIADPARTDAGTATANNFGKKSFIPQNLELTLALARVTGDLVNFAGPYAYRITKKGLNFEVTGGIQNELNATLTDKGVLTATLSSPSPISASAKGSLLFDKNEIDLDITDIVIDMSRIKGFLTYPVFAVKNGVITGAGTITGKITDPEFNGDLLVKDFDFALPKYLTEEIHIDTIPVLVMESTFRIEPVNLPLASGTFLFDAFAYFDRWRFDTLSMSVKTNANTTLPGKFDLGFMNVTGDAMGTMNIDVTTDLCVVEGNLKVENGSAEIISLSTGGGKKYKSKMETKVNLTVEVGQKTEICYPSRKSPIVWGQVVPRTKLYIVVDTAKDIVSFKSDISIRGGEVVYIGRNFFLREGRLVFDGTEGVFDPRVTFKAEIRERDADNRMVRIVLSAENQLFSQLTPKLSSSPTKTEAELMELLGNALFADTLDSDAPIQQLAVGLIDFGAQMSVFRQVERQLRKFLKFDIFSFRTFALQKTMLSVFNMGNYDKPFSVASLLDNTTVYVGKYFGEAIYADAMLQLVFDENRQNERLGIFSGLYVQPEIGIEMESPFANIRWSIAPDIANFKNLWIPDNKLTISWKFQL